VTDSDFAGDVARRAAERLAGEIDPRLPIDVEAELHGTTAQPERYLDPVSVAGLVVSIASLAWTIGKDLRAHKTKPTAALVARRIRITLDAGNTTDLPAATRDRVIDVVIDEALTALPPPHDDPTPPTGTP
jgi:hypothetical protein